MEDACNSARHFLSAEAAAKDLFQELISPTLPIENLLGPKVNHFLRIGDAIKSNDATSAATNSNPFEYQGICMKDWVFGSRKSHITSVELLEKFGEEAKLTPPEMVFGGNQLLFLHIPTGVCYNFVAIEALKRAHFGSEGEAHRQLKVAIAKQRAANDQVKELDISYDWTFTTDYCGNLSRYIIRDQDSEALDLEFERSKDDVRVEITNDRIDLEKLKEREPILWFEDVSLFEDELHDHGISVMNVKVRVMESGFFILARFWLRLDHVILRVYETRVHHLFGQKFMLRERTKKEATVDELATRGHSRNMADYRIVDSFQQYLQIKESGCDWCVTQLYNPMQEKIKLLYPSYFDAILLHTEDSIAYTVAQCYSGRLNTSKGRRKRPPSSIDTTNKPILSDIISVDFSGVFDEPRHLQDLVQDLYKPFRNMHINAVIAMRQPQNDLIDSANQRLASAIMSTFDLECGTVTIKQRNSSDRKIASAKSQMLLVSAWLNDIVRVQNTVHEIEKENCIVVGICSIIVTDCEVARQRRVSKWKWSYIWAVKEDHSLMIDRSSVKFHHIEKGSVQIRAGNGFTQLIHCTCQYAANLPCEDCVFTQSEQGSSLSLPQKAFQSALYSDIAIYGVLDGHGGRLAVDSHVKNRLVNEIFSRLRGKTRKDSIVRALKEAFVSCDDMLKSYLASLSPKQRCGRGYCNAGACAIVAVFLGPTLHVANIGDCAAVLATHNIRSNKITKRYNAKSISVLHNCDNIREIQLVERRTKDRYPIRVAKGKSGDAIKRVAGSLAVTRAFGDFYLKCKEMSNPPYSTRVPYITARPSVRVRELKGNEKFLILGSDGFWDLMQPNDAVQLAASRANVFEASIAPDLSKEMVLAALQKCVEKEGIPWEELIAKPLGDARRRVHDDITITVIQISKESRLTELSSQ